MLVCSTMKMPEIAEHLDTGTWLAMTGRTAGNGRPEGKVFPTGSDVAIGEAVTQAMEAGAAEESD